MRGEEIGSATRVSLHHGRSERPRTPPLRPGRQASGRTISLEQTIGNRAIAGLFRAGRLQAKLAVSRPGDAAEREADRIADRVMQKSDRSETAEGRGSIGDEPARTLQQGRASEPLLSRQAIAAEGACTPAPGLTPSNCSAYAVNAWWLPIAYVNNATCACLATPDSPTANCVRKFLQDRLAATPGWLKALAASHKPMELNPLTHGSYQTFVQAMLTPRIYRDHVDAYASCCCPSGPADYWSWIGVTTVPIQPCSVVGDAINHFGSCHGTPGTW